MRNVMLAFAAIACFAVGAQAQLALNEIYMDDFGADEFEFIEIIGTPGTSLNDVFVCIVEGDGSFSAGILDRAIDLSGNVIPASGYFHMAMGGNMDPTADLIVSDSIENGTNTFYLLQAQDPTGLVAALGTNIGDQVTLTTTIGNFGAILDTVGYTDSSSGTDFNFDGGPVIGPAPQSTEGGIFRNGDFPNAFSSIFFLDPDPLVNLNQPATPGAPNTFIPMVSAAFPGNTGDVAMEILKNGAVDFQMAGIHSVASTDNFGVEISSPMGTLDNNPFALAATVYPTGMSPIMGALQPSSGGTILLDAWVDLGSTFLLLDGTSNPNPLSPRISPFGFEYGPFNSDVSLAGTSVLLQVIVDAPGFGAFQFATSDARELNFTM